jgi:hypothetical protein
MTASIFATPAAFGRSILQGTWKIVNNGFPGDLVLRVDSNGRVSGTVYGQEIFGFWDEDAKKIIFVRIINRADPTSYQIFTGFLFTPAYRLNTGQSGEVAWMLAGYFEAFSGSGATAQRILYGWHAKHARVG